MFYSKEKHQSKVLNRRKLVILISKFSFISIIGWKLFDIQISKSKKYKMMSKKNQINFQIIYPLRGNILDRNNKIIVTNNNTYDLYLIPEQIPNINKTLNELNKLIPISFRDKRKIIELSKKVKKFQRVIILRNIFWEDLEIIESSKNNFPGVHLEMVPQRVYLEDNYFSHIVGYTNKPSAKDFNLPFVSDMPTLDVGKSGIEKFLNEDLIGYPGKREIEVNAFGREIREISIKKSLKGKSINTSLDSRLQKFVYNEINKHKAASVVVMNVNSGEILSMVSFPDYNPNLIIQKPNKKYWNQLLDNSLSPLTNRCIQGLYAPGSAFKMIVALAGLHKGVISNTFCEGKIEFGDRFYHCWKTKGHGEMNMLNAIKESCDVYFYELSKRIGIDEISKMAKEFGLGEISKIGLESEKAGIVPSKKWKKRTLKQNWYAGETLIAGIGQGYVLSTPLQLAIMTARIANNGKKVEPTFLLSESNQKDKQIDIKPSYIDLVKKAMFKVVNEQRGTAFKSKSNNYVFSGKTGTSQVKRISLEERESEDFRKIEKKWKDKDHALFVGYMPSDKPKYSISVVVEHGGSGASTAAPIAKNIFDYLYKINLV